MRKPNSKSSRRHAAVFAGLTSLVAGSGAALATRPVAGSVTPERLKVPSGPGSVKGLAGEPAVDPFYASVNYQVPIELPSGFGGLAPSLALTYSGALGNGSLGIGWTLAQTRIQRSTHLGVPKFDASDELEISGVASGRLVAISATEYRVEGMGQTVRIVKSGSGFEVDDGSGLHLALGLSAAGRQQTDDSHVTAWLCEAITNTMGERVQYEYLHDQNQVYLTRMTWGPGGVYQAQLDYESRADVVRSLREGFPVVTARRLHAIRVIAFGVEKRAYQMQYDASFAVARLAGVTSTGELGAGSWPALSFTYAAPSVPTVTPISGNGSWRLDSNGVTMVDLDGDGAADLLQLASGDQRYALNRKGVFQAPVPMQNSLNESITTLQLQDVDGDARADLLLETQNGWHVWKWTKTQWVEKSSAWPGTGGIPLKQPSSARFADLDGDGLVDAIQWTNDNLIIKRATATGLLDGVIVPKIAGTELPTAAGRFHDVNGDGLDDYVVVRSDRLDEYLGHGDGRFDAATPIAYPPGFVTWNPDNVELGDLDRDGVMDLVRVDLGKVYWFRGKPDGTFSSTALSVDDPEPLSSTVTVMIADSNGNGSHDVVWSSTSGMWRMELAGPATAGMLTRVQNGLGMDVTFDYASSHALSADARQAGSPWLFEVPIAMPVPTEKRTTLGPGEVTRQVDYTVRDGVWDAVEQRFAGFLTTTVTTWGATPAETGSVITHYLNSTSSSVDRELRGKPQTEQIYDGTGKRISLTTHRWHTMPVSGLPDVPLLRAAFLDETQVQHEDTSPAVIVETTFTPDGFGRPTHEVDSGRLDVTGDEAVKDTTYADDNTTWIRNKVCEEKVSESGPNGAVKRDVRHYFGDDTVQEALCVVGKGWPREDEAWLDNGSRWVSQQSTRYDAHGNPTAMIEGGVETDLVYDAQGLFPIEEHHVSSTGGADLVWHATWNQVLGVVTDVTDPNGHVSHSTYDSLGRFSGASIDSHPAHQLVVYDWTPPYPKTTTYQYDGSFAYLDSGMGPFPGIGWRKSVEVANGLGETRYRAQALGASWIISDYQVRDPNSRVVFAARPFYSGVLELAGLPKDAAGDSLQYDPIGRLIQQTAANGTQRAYAYTAFERTVTDDAQEPGALAPVHSELDGQGRAIMTERTLGDGTHEIVHASYDAAGRMTAMWLGDHAVDRTFTYDTLGRLHTSSDPDLGTRTLTWDDGGRLLTEQNAAGQTVTYTYDGHGRLATRDAGSPYTYHYDQARPGAGASAVNQLGRLAWVEEPTGSSDVGYDLLGRVSFTRRIVDGETSEATSAYAPSGLMLSRSYDDGFALSFAYDAAGRPVGIPGYWQLRDQDASGAPLVEAMGNGTEADYQRDVLGLATRVTLHDADGQAIYDGAARRNAWSAITQISDLDQVGLDHSATFTYDGFARLTAATIGSGAAQFGFAYAYDVLHNMTSRTMTGPHSIGGFFGTEHYGEQGHAQRQLTSITDAAGHVTHSFDYDAAGRQTAQDDLHMTFDASDRLLEVDGLPGGSVLHTYGHDGQRLKTVEPDGTIDYFFGDGTAERNGVREHDVTVGDRVIARVSMTDAGGQSPLAALEPGASPRRLILVVAALALGGAAVIVRRRRRG